MSIPVYAKATLQRSKPKIAFPPRFDFRNQVRELGPGMKGGLVYEFVGTDDFGAEWQERQRFEVNAGRDEEPILYLPLYDEVRDASLPKNVTINELGPAGVVMTQINEGGEIKFATIGEGQRSVQIIHYGVGLEYSKDLVVFNETWNVAIVERQVGIAYNALLNHAHLNPILAATYAAGNKTAANTAGATVVEDHLLTIEDAIVNSVSDATNPRRGPYYILCSIADLYVLQKALTRVPQQGVELQNADAINSIRGLIAYDGWSGTMNGKTTTYTGVSAGTCYLISQQYRGQDFRSWMKQDLQNAGEQQDITRLMTQTVWDTYFGVYANPTAAVEEVTLP